MTNMTNADPKILSDKVLEDVAGGQFSYPPLHRDPVLILNPLSQLIHPVHATLPVLRLFKIV